MFVADASFQLAELKVNNHPNGKAVAFDVNDEEKRNELINSSSVVISLLPPAMHYQIALACLRFSVSLFTASYTSKEIAALHEDALKKNILILMETGLDPGIDHMSAMKELEIIREKGGKLISFKSYTGGLIAPESDDNPWHYKITWNPRNVVTAGKGISKYLEEGNIVEVGYKELFSVREKIFVEGYGEFEGYPNRDSLSYLDTYQLKEVKTFLRGTLRRAGYCSGWNVLVNMGYTDDDSKIVNKEMSFLELSEKLTGKKSEKEVIKYLKSKGATDDDLERIKWLGCFSTNPIEEEYSSLFSKNFSLPSLLTPADTLQILLEKNWKMKSDDKDMIVMQHQFEYDLNGKLLNLISSLVVTGEDESHTAMAKTVGLPLAIAVKLFLEGRIQSRGVQIPIIKEIYLPVLKELEEKHGIHFINIEKEI